MLSLKTAPKRLSLGIFAALNLLAPLSGGVLVEDDFTGAATDNLDGNPPTLNAVNGSSWVASTGVIPGFLLADGSLDDAPGGENNVDRGAFLDLGAGFFASDSIYRLSIDFGELDDAAIFVGFTNQGSPSLTSTAQIQGSANLAIRARDFGGSDSLAIWNRVGTSNNVTAVDTSGNNFDAASYQAVMTIRTNSLTDAEVSVDFGALSQSISGVDLSTMRHFYVAVEDAATGSAQGLMGRLNSVKLEQNPGPVAHWSFDGASPAERLVESYGRSSLDATEAGGSVAWNTRTGFGDVLATGTTTPYLSVPQGPELAFGSGSFTFSIWSYRTSQNGTASGIIDANGGQGYQFFFQGDETLRLRLDDDLGNSAIFDTTGSHYQEDTWQLLSFTVDRQNNLGRLYVDGVEASAPGGVDISALTGSLSPNQDLWIASLNANTINPARGRLDEPTFFDRALSATEIAQIAAGTPVLSLYPPTASPVPPPVVSIAPAGGTVSTGSTVTLSADDPTAEIFYTTDGTDPATGGIAYTSPISLLGPTVITAKARFPGEAFGDAVTAEFFTVPSTPPNLLIVVANGLGWGDLHCYGSVNTLTPNADRLAYEGSRFTQFQVPGPGYFGNQYSLLTGRLASRSGLLAEPSTGDPGIRSEEWTLAEAFRKSGFRTGFFGHWHLGGGIGSYPLDQGFQHFTGVTGAAPSGPLRNESGVIEASPLPSQSRSTITNAAVAFLGQPGPFACVVQIPDLPANGTSIGGSHGNRVEAADATLGALMGELEAQDRLDDTLVLFLTSGGADRSAGNDNPGSNGMLRDGAGTAWEGAARACLLARWPGFIASPLINLDQLSATDLMPSLAALAGAYLPTDRPLDGLDRNPTLAGLSTRPSGTAQSVSLLPVGGALEVAAIRQGEWKLHLEIVETDPDTSTGATAPALYNLHTDPSERINRATANPSVVSDLTTLAGSISTSLPAPGSADTPAPKPPLTGPLEKNFLSIPTDGVFLEFTRPRDSIDDHYLIERSNDLDQWDAVPVTDFVTSLTTSGGNETLQLEVPFTNPLGTREFIRFRYLRPANP